MAAKKPKHVQTSFTVEKQPVNVFKELEELFRKQNIQYKSDITTLFMKVNIT